MDHFKLQHDADIGLCIYTLTKIVKLQKQTLATMNRNLVATGN